MLIEVGGLLLGSGILVKGVQGLWAIAKAIGSYEASTAKCLEHLTEMARDHESRIRALEDGDARKRR
jgi:hypothetical protein